MGCYSCTKTHGGPVPFSTQCRLREHAKEEERPYAPRFTVRAPEPEPEPAPEDEEIHYLSPGRFSGRELSQKEIRRINRGLPV